MSIIPPRLLLITDLSLCPDLETTIAIALQGGTFDLLLRDKTSPASALTQLAHRLLQRLKPAGGRLLIHDRIDLALTINADGVHLPESGMSTADARRLLGPDRLLGRSCHDSRSAACHLQNGGDYVTLSPIFWTASHPDAVPLGVEQFAKLRAAIPGAVLALGGIQTHNVKSAMQTGAHGVALIRGILNATNPDLAVRNLLTCINKS